MGIVLSALQGILLDYYALNGRRSVERSEQIFAHVLRILGDVDAASIDYRRLLSYAAQRQREGRAPATIQQELSVLRKAYVEASKAGLCAVPQFPTIQIDNVREKFFRVDDLNRVIEELPEPFDDLVRLLLYTGWRKNEIAKLTWSDVDFNDQVIHLRAENSKTNRGRFLPFSASTQVRELLWRRHGEMQRIRHEQEISIPWVIWHLDPRFFGQRVKEFRKSWKRALRAAGLDEDYRVHDIRRTAAVYFRRAGVPKVVAMKIQGHRTDAMYRRYGIVDEWDISVGMRKASEHLAKKSGGGGGVNA